jgi:homoserine kinase
VAVRYGVPVTVRVPATTANLGPGFDSLGMAFDLHDEVTVEALEPEGSGGPTVDVEVSGAGAGAVPLGEDHLVVRSVRAGLARAGAGRPSLRMRCRNVIPHGRGLGSSASAVVAGLVAARGLLTDPAALDDATVFDLATAAEGHPDNASAAVFGGFTVSWTDDGPAGAVPAAHTVSMPVDPRLSVVVCVPDGDLATSRARAMLPATVPHGDAAFNAGRAALLVEAVTRRPELLFAATADRLHQEQRATAMPASAALLHALRAAGAAAVVSGAGPSILVLGTGSGPVDTVRRVLGGGGEGERWQVLAPAVVDRGAHLIT